MGSSVVEQESSRRGQWVFCSGLRRSGSTVQYQIAKTLVESTGRGVGLGFAEPKNWIEIVRRHAATPGLRVVKCHRYLPGAASLLRKGGARSLFIHRDLRDVCVSWMKMRRLTFDEVMEEEFFDELLEDDFHWSGRPNTMTSVYERMLDDLTGEVRRIADFLGIPIDGEEAERIADLHSLGRQQRRIESFDFERKGIRHGHKTVYDPGTLLHHNHVNSGAARQWEHALTPAQVERIEEVTGDWLSSHGYALTGSRSTAPAIPLRKRMGLTVWRWATDRGLRLRLRLGDRLLRLPAPIRAVGRAVIKGLVSVRVARLLGRPMYALLPGSSTVGLASAKRILVVRLDRIGDVILTVPFLRELRRNAPSAEITVVVRPEARDLLEHSPFADRVLTFDPDVASRVPELVRRVRLFRLARAHLWGRRPDIAVIPRWGTDHYDAPFLVYFSGAHRRVGYAQRAKAGRGSAEKRRLDDLLTEVLNGANAGHEVEQNLRLLELMGGVVEERELELELAAPERAYASRVWDENRLETGPVVAMGVGASHLRRLWPAERYAELAVRLAETHGARTLLIGGPGERALGAAVKNRAGDAAIDLVGTTTLRQAAALLERCNLFVGNDSGVLHIAAATGTPIVGIWSGSVDAPEDASQSPARFGPWGVAAVVLQPDAPLAPCSGSCTAPQAHCICEVTVEEVEHVAEDLLTPAETTATAQAGGV